MSNSLTVNKLDLSTLDIARAFLIVGKKGSGKTTMLISLLVGLMLRIDFGFAMCGSQSGLRSLQRALPAEVIYDGLDMNRFDLIIKTLSRVTNANHAYRRVTAAILDDVSFHKQFFKSLAIRQSVMNGRWMWLALFITQQYLMDVGPEIRSQLDYVFALGEPSGTVRRKLYTYYFDIFPSFAEFDKVFVEVTKKKGRAIVIDNTSSSPVIQERIFYFDSELGLEDRLVLGSSHFRNIISRERDRQVARAQAVGDSLTV